MFLIFLQKLPLLLSLLAGHDSLPQNKLRRSFYDEHGFENPIRESYNGPNSYVTSFGSDISVCDDYESFKNEKFRLLDGDTFDSVYFENFPPFDEEEDDILSFNDDFGGTLSQHAEIIKPLALQVFQKFPFPIHKKIPVPIPHPVLGWFLTPKVVKHQLILIYSIQVPYPEPYPIHIEVSEPYAVPVYRDLKIPVEKEVKYPIEKRVPVKIDKPVGYEVEKHQLVYVPKPFPVKVC